MGIYDRDYARDDDARPPMALGQSMVLTIIVINVAVWLANLFFDPQQDRIMYFMSANVYSLIYPWLWWQLLTCGFAHDPNDVWHLMFNMVGLWFLGTHVERVLGRWEFLRFYLVAIVVGSVVHNLLFMAFIGQQAWPPPYLFGAAGILGASGAVVATVMLFIFKFPRMQLLLFFAIPVPAWLVGVLIIAQDVLGAGGWSNPLLGGTEEAQRVAYHVHLAGAAFAFLYFHYKWNFGRLVPSRLVDALRGMGRAMRPGPKLRVHAPDDDGPAEDYHEQDEAADRILVKIDREGIESLTPAEERILEDYSRRLRQKRQ